MLARAAAGVPSCSCRADRYLAGRARRAALRRHGPPAGRRVSAFRSLHRDVDLLVIGRRDLERPMTLPGGRLREPLDALVADALVLARRRTPCASRSRPADVEPRCLALAASPSASRADGPPRHGARGGRSSLSRASRARRVSSSDLRGAGMDVASDCPFAITIATARRPRRASRSRLRAPARAAILTTEKDLVRLLPAPAVAVSGGLRADAMAHRARGRVLRAGSTLSLRAASAISAVGRRAAAARRSGIASSTPRCRRRARCVRLLPMRGGAGRLARCSACASTPFDRPHRRLALDATSRRRFRRARTRSARAIARDMFVHFGRLLLELLKFST